MRGEDTAVKEQPSKAVAVETPLPDAGGATGLGTQLSSVAGPTLQVGSACNYGRTCLPVLHRHTQLHATSGKV